MRYQSFNTIKKPIYSILIFVRTLNILWVCAPFNLTDIGDTKIDIRIV